MTGPHDPQPHDPQPGDDPLARRYRELGTLGTRAAGAPDLGDLLRRDRQRERRRVTGTALAVVSTMGVAAWVGSALLGAGRGGPQTLPAAPVAVSTAARHTPAADRTGTSRTAPPAPTSAGATSAPAGPSVTPVVGTPTSDPPSGSAVGTATRSVQVWFESTTTRSDGCHPLRAVTREVTADDPVTAALHQLLLGPTKAEQQAGLRSDIGAGLAAGASVTHAGGSVIVDLGGLGRLAGVPTACRRTQVAGPLNQTLSQFTSVKTRVFTIRGDAAAFRAYLNGTPAP